MCRAGRAQAHGREPAASPPGPRPTQRGARLGGPRRNALPAQQRLRGGGRKRRTEGGGSGGRGGAEAADRGGCFRRRSRGGRLDVMAALGRQVRPRRRLGSPRVAAPGRRWHLAAGACPGGRCAHLALGALGSVGRLSRSSARLRAGQDPGGTRAEGAGGPRREPGSGERVGSADCRARRAVTWGREGASAGSAPRRPGALRGLDGNGNSGRRRADGALPPGSSVVAE